MSTLKALLKDVPVEWKDLGDVLIRSKGTKITAEQMKVLHKDGAPIKIFAGGKTVAFFNYEDIPEKDINFNPSIIVKSRGIIEFEFYDKPFSHKNEMWSYYSNKNEVNIKYVYYLLKINEQYFQNIGNRMQMPQISTPVTDKFQIPIPYPNDPEKSLAIQQEIVRVLDGLSEQNKALTTALAQEIDQRKKQYEYYREDLFRFEGKEVEWKTLGEVAENLDAMRKPVKSGSRDLGDIPYYGASGIVDYVKDYIFDGDFLLVSEDGANLLARSTPIAFSVSGKCWVNNHAHILKFENQYHRKLVEYYLNSIDLEPYITGAAQPKLNQKNLNKIKVPVIVHKLELKRVVSLLDQFDEATKNIVAQLEKEIELRNKQYEYYRNLLFSFPN